MFNEEQISQLNQTALVAGTIGAIGAFCTIIVSGHHLSKQSTYASRHIIYHANYVLPWQILYILIVILN
jgi:hypothetical protein